MAKKQTKKSETKVDSVPKSEVTWRPTKKQLIIGLVILIAVLVICVLAPRLLGDSDSKSAQAKKVTVQVEKMLLLPEESDPTVIEVSDTARLKNTNPDFYKNVEEGDYLLMYSNKAVIYRQETNQIINVAPIASQSELSDK